MTGTGYLLLSLCSSTLLWGMADREQSVAAGREALDRWVWQYPWYDSQTDGVRPVEVSPPWHVRWPWLRDLFSFRGGRLGSMSWLGWLAGSVIAVLLIVLIYLLVRAYLLSRHRRAGSTPEAAPAETVDDKRRTEALPAAAARNRSDLLAEARWHYEQGNYGEAIVYLFSYQLVQLDKRQVLRLTKGKTNRQYLRELGPRITLRQLVEQTMVAFEEVFFGNYSIDRARFESVWSRLGEFDALVAEGAT